MYVYAVGNTTMGMGTHTLSGYIADHHGGTIQLRLWFYSTLRQQEFFLHQIHIKNNFDEDDNTYGGYYK